MKNKILNAKKILIIGESGRGKTTLSIKLSEKLKLPFQSTDDFFWKTKYSERNNIEESIEMVKQIYSADKWIVEGSTTHLIEPALEKADVIISLTFKNIAQQWLSLIKRYVSKEKNEKFGQVFGLMVYVTRKRFGIGNNKEKLKKELLKPYNNKMLVISSFSEIDNLLT
ncbi:MAG: hypothetical protein AAB621_02780 [Patescibacteria group bacterium]